MSYIKKQGAGTWISIITVIVGIVALIIYGAATGAGMGLEIASGSQPFYEASRPEDSAMLSTVVTCGVIALVCLAVGIVLGQFKSDSIVGKVCAILSGALRIVAPALLLLVLLNFAYGSLTGLGWTFFSNEELSIAAEAIAVGKQVITGLVFFAVAAVAAIVAAFFGVVRKEQN